MNVKLVHLGENLQILVNKMCILVEKYTFYEETNLTKYISSLWSKTMKNVMMTMAATDGDDGSYHVLDGAPVVLGRGPAGAWVHQEHSVHTGRVLGMLKITIMTVKIIVMMVIQR